MTNITYYLFGHEAVREYFEGSMRNTKKAIENGDGAIYAHNESDHSSVLVDQMDGWHEATTISKEEFDILN